MAEKAIDVVMGNFKWFNEVMEKPDHVITREEVEQRYAPDARMIANGQLKCAGIDAHLKHFRELQTRLKSLKVRFPLEECITNADECAAYYKIDYVMADGSAGIVHDSALWRVRDGKVALMVESAAFEGPEIPLDNHK
jgi:ketosteroid isomerase-like protein